MGKIFLSLILISSFIFAKGIDYTIEIDDFTDEKVEFFIFYQKTGEYYDELLIKYFDSKIYFALTTPFYVSEKNKDVQYLVKTRFDNNEQKDYYFYRANSGNAYDRWVVGNNEDEIISNILSSEKLTIQYSMNNGDIRTITFYLEEFKNFLKDKLTDIPNTYPKVYKIINELNNNEKSNDFNNENNEIKFLDKNKFDNLEDGWHLLGTGSIINDMSVFSNIKTIWAFENNKWVRNPAEIKELTGFWIYK